jgi:GT2 family glycosyltransferase
MINVSIVLYHPDWEQVTALTKTLLLSQFVAKVYWVDNSPVVTQQLPLQSDKIEYIYNNRNLGYGAAHNIAIRQSVYDNIPFHLVINPDIILDVNQLDSMYCFISTNPQVGSLMPKVTYPNGELQYLCKLLPTPLDVFGRRFLPKAWTKKRNYRYQMQASGYERIMNVPYLSGCFMLLRTEAVLRVRLFDERFFMYPEDMDLTRRIHRDYLTVYFPRATIIHNHEKASYKSLKMLWIHMVNMCRYFNKWGWFRDPERTLFNQTAAKEYL